MRSSKILAKLRAGGIARVCSTGSPLPFFPHLAATSNYDAVILDAEHRPWNPSDTTAMLSHCRSADIDSLWRSPTLEPVGLSRVMEDGATGVMIPMVDTAEAAQRIVQAVKFPPLGNRGLDGSWVDGDFGAHSKEAYVAHAIAETLVVLMIESPQGVANAEEIASLPGVDILFIGPGDLSLRLGCKPSLEEPKIQAAITQVSAACAKHGKTFGYPVKNTEDAQTLLQEGARFLMMGSETVGLKEYLQRCGQTLDTVCPTSEG